MSRVEFIKELAQTHYVRDWAFANAMANCPETPLYVLNRLYDEWSKMDAMSNKTHVTLFTRILRHRNTSRELHDKIVDKYMSNRRLTSDLITILSENTLMSQDALDRLSKDSSSAIRGAVAVRPDLNNDIVERLMMDSDELVCDFCARKHYPEVHKNNPKYMIAYREKRQEEKEYIVKTNTEDIYDRLTSCDFED